MSDWETPCPKRADKIHCNCWYDGKACCACGAPAEIVDPSNLEEYTMRTINTHAVNPVNDTIKISVLDEPGAGGANHHYLVTLPDWSRAPDGSGAKGVWDIQFQNGPIAENGVNGLTQEVLLAIVADRLQCFQKGPYACQENADALTHVEAAQAILQSRTKARMARGVEGVSVV